MKKVLIACYESGGANILSSWIKGISPDFNLYYCLDGPAVDIFSRTLGQVRMVDPDFIDRLSPESDEVITGTSWVPDLERNIISLAKQAHIPTTSVLDHWTNYRQRFLPIDLWEAIPGDWAHCLPDHIWVCDNYAYQLAVELGFPEEKLIRKPNYYLDYLAQDVAKKLDGRVYNGDSLRVLYLAEPIADDLQSTYGDPNAWGYTEFDLVESLVKALEKINANGQLVEVRVRLHPNEQHNKYNHLLDRVDNISLSSAEDLLDDLAWSQCVLGGQSMALVIALLAKRIVFSCIPKKASITCCLPHKEIIKEDDFYEIFSRVNANTVKTARKTVLSSVPP